MTIPVTTPPAHPAPARGTERAGSGTGGATSFAALLGALTAPTEPTEPTLPTVPTVPGVPGTPEDAAAAVPAMLLPAVGTLPDGPVPSDPAPDATAALPENQDTAETLTGPPTAAATPVPVDLVGPALGADGRTGTHEQVDPDPSDGAGVPLSDGGPDGGTATATRSPATPAASPAAAAAAAPGPAAPAADGTPPPVERRPVAVGQLPVAETRAAAPDVVAQPAPVPLPATAPTATGAPAATEPPVAPAPLAHQLRAGLASLRSAPAGDHTLTLSVAPEHLGPVTVRAHIGADGVRIELFAPDLGREALRAILPDLRRDLAVGGLQGATLDVATQDLPGGQAEPRGGAEPGRGTSARAPGHATPPPTPAPAPTTHPATARTGGLDILL